MNEILLAAAVLIIPVVPLGHIKFRDQGRLQKMPEKIIFSYFSVASFGLEASNRESAEWG